MKLKEIEILLNANLKSLTGVKVESFKEFNRLKNEAISEIAKEFNFNVRTWSLSLELNNESGDKRFKEVFKMVRDTRNDRLFVFNEPNTLSEVKVVLTREMEKYADADISSLNTLYSRDCMKIAIQRQREYIEQMIQKMNNEKLILSNFEKEYAKIEKKFSLAL